MKESSPHVVAHRRSSAYKLFIKAAEAHDVFFNKPTVGDFSPTVQKFYRGISTPRYVKLVCLEYPVILFISLLDHIVLPVIGFYMLMRVLYHVVEGQLGIGLGALFSFSFLLGTLLTALLTVGAWSGVMSWANSEPSYPVRWYRNRYLRGKDPDFDDFPNKFPGAIAIFKKWLLAPTSSSITWDSGKKRAGWE